MAKKMPQHLVENFPGSGTFHLNSALPATGGIPSTSQANLLDLPRELRDIIYEYTVVPCICDCIFANILARSSLWTEYVSHACCLKCDQTQPSLTRVCRLLRKEYLPLYYRSQILFIYQSTIVHKFSLSIRSSPVICFMVLLTHLCLGSGPLDQKCSLP